MKINTVELVNIGPHAHLKVSLGTGLIGILGKNGAGKSTFVNSIYSALTNDFSRFAGNKPDLIRSDSDKEEPSFIYVEGEHRGQEFKLTRSLRPNKNKLVFNGETYSKAQEVNTVFEQQLGISKFIIDRYVFVNQWEIFQFLSQTDSERAKAFQFLCGTETASQIYKACSDYVTKHKDREVTDNRVALQEALEEAEERISKYSKVAKKLKKLLVDKAEEKEKGQQVIELAKKARQAAIALEEIEEEKQETEEEVTDCKSLAKRIEKRIESFAEELQTLRDREDYANAVFLAENEQKVLTVASKIKSYTLSISKAKAKIAELEQQDVAMPEGYLSEEQRETSKEKLAEMEAEAKPLKSFLANFDGKESAQCPCCNQQVDKAFILQSAKQFKALTDAIGPLRARIAASAQYDRDASSLFEELDKAKSNVSHFSELLEEIKAQVPSSIIDGVSDYQEILKAEKELVRSVNIENKRLSETVSRLDSAKSKLSTLKSSTAVTTYEEQIKGKPTKEEVLAAKEAISDYEACLSKFNEVKGAYNESKKSRERSVSLLESLEKQLEKQAEARKVLSVVEDTGKIFHWNSLPKAVSQANLELLISDVNSNLELFNNPFQVKAGDDLDFKVYFPGSHSAIDARQLSGGQKVILAISFRAALDKVFGNNIGILFLDEPTAGLDDDNISYFHEALRGLAEKVGYKRQLVVITHVQGMGEIFDQQITIGA